jgi:hypothetical protein
MRAGVLGVAAALAAAPAARAQESDADLAHKLNNPVAAMISLPFQGNYDCCYGPENGARYVLNIQPVVPFKLTDQWNLIVRTIVPVIHQNRVSPADGASSGFGDTTQSFFFATETHGLTWAVGPAILWPTGTSGLGAGKWGAGPTVLLLKATSTGYTVGVLANHVWSMGDAGGGASRPAVSSTFVQPFLAWTSRNATTINLNTESTYNWEDGQWSIPINLSVSHLYKFGTQRVSLGGGVRVYAARDAVKPADPAWGLRFTATLLFPQ